MKHMINAIALVTTLVFVGQLSATTINWGVAQNSTAATDVLNTGTTVDAINATSTGNVGSVTVNGVTFTNSSILPNNTGSSFLVGNTTGDANYDALLDTLDFGGGTATSINVGAGSLVAGNDYSIQVWFTDLRSCCSNRTMTYGDGMGNTVNVHASLGGLGQYAIGTFTAGGTSQTLSLTTNNFGNAHISAYQVRETPPVIPEPATAMLGLIAVGGLAMRRHRVV